MKSKSSSYYIDKQLVDVFVGAVVWFIATAVPYKAWRRYAPWLVLASIISLVLLYVPGLSVQQLGATRWVRLGPVTIQPSELLKLTTIIYLAGWFEEQGSNKLRSIKDGLIPFSVIIGTVSILIAIFQKDLGTMAVLILAAAGMYYVAGMKSQHLVLFGSGAVAAGFLAVVAFPHRISRFLTFLNPNANLTTQGYQINQALIAVGSGGLFGVGLGKSIQIYGYLPEAANDSIFAVIAEEFGLIGSLIIVVLFGILVYRGLQIARTAPDAYSRILATGISLWVLFQAAINIGAMLSLLPLTGIPLPFISYGGTSLVFTLVGMGMLLNISKYTTREDRHANSSERGRQRRTHLTNSGDSRRVKAA
jgi:cell division protein FtsW